jgi:hypothetical protein
VRKRNKREKGTFAEFHDHVSVQDAPIGTVADLADIFILIGYFTLRSFNQSTHDTVMLSSQSSSLIINNFTIFNLSILLLPFILCVIRNRNRFLMRQEVCRGWWRREGRGWRRGRRGRHKMLRPKPRLSTGNGEISKNGSWDTQHRPQERSDTTTVSQRTRYGQSLGLNCHGQDSQCSDTKDL